MLHTVTVSSSDFQLRCNAMQATVDQLTSYSHVDNVRQKRRTRYVTLTRHHRIAIVTLSMAFNTVILFCRKSVLATQQKLTQWNA